MAKQRSLKHEYELYVERELEEFKDSVPRSTLLAIGDEAVAALGAQAQLTLTEMVLWEEVDRLIARRLKIPAYAAWRRRRLRKLAEFRRPERWGLAPNGALACALRAAVGEHVVLAGPEVEETSLFSAALGCSVTALTHEPESLDRVFAAADSAGVGSQVRGCVCDLGAWAPDVSLSVVVCVPEAFAAFAADERSTALDGLRSATRVGGVHLLDGRHKSQPTVSFDEWCSWYPGWAVSSEGPSDAVVSVASAVDGGSAGATYIARRLTA